MKVSLSLFAAIQLLVRRIDAFVVKSSYSCADARCVGAHFMHSQKDDVDVSAPAAESSRRHVLQGLIASGTLAASSFLSSAPAANALVEGYAPPGKSKALGEEYRQGTAALADMDEMAPVPREAYKKLPSGVTYADLRVGSGETADVGKKCNVQWVLRKSNGYFVDSSDVSGGVPFIFTVGEKGGAIQGVDEGVRGMKVGGTRRLLIPPSLAYVEGLEDGKPGPLPVGFGPRQQMRRVQGVRKDVPGEYIFLEIALTKVR